MKGRFLHSGLPRGLWGGLCSTPSPLPGGQWGWGRIGGSQGGFRAILLTAHQRISSKVPPKAPWLTNQGQDDWEVGVEKSWVFSRH